MISSTARLLVVIDIIETVSKTGSKHVPLFSNSNGYILLSSSMKMGRTNILYPVVTFDDATKMLSWAPPATYGAGNFTDTFIITLVTRPDK